MCIIYIHYIGRLMSQLYTNMGFIIDTKHMQLGGRLLEKSKRLLLLHTTLEFKSP